jgi:hypothetical protein
VSQTLSLALHAAVTLALIGAYTALTVLNHDGNAILAVLLGYLGGTSVGLAPGASGK